jgi:hypothetical protein
MLGLRTRLNRQLRLQTQAFRRGLADLLNPEWLTLFDPRELQVGVVYYI